MSAKQAARRTVAVRLPPVQSNRGAAAAADTRYNRAIAIALHVAMIAASNYTAFLLRFDGDIPPYGRDLFRYTIPALLAIRVVVFAAFRLLQDVWRDASTRDLRNTVWAVACSTGIFYVLIHDVLGIAQYPRSLFVIDALVLVFAMSAVRMATTPR